MEISEGVIAAAWPWIRMSGELRIPFFVFVRFAMKCQQGSSLNATVSASEKNQIDFEFHAATGQ